MRRKFLSGLLISVLVLVVGGPSAPGSEAADLAQQGGRPSQAQLDEYHTRVLALFENPNVVFTDVDERAGRLTVAVQNARAAPSVREQLGQLGVPVGLVDVVVSPPIVEMATLRDKWRPIAGGIQITFVKKALGYLCTMNVNAVRDVDNVEGFVTNSHCTEKQGEVNSTKHRQPDFADANLIGIEIADPAYFTGGICPKGKKCRYSDSAFSQRVSGVSASLGHILRPDSLGSINVTLTDTNGDGTADPPNTFQIVGEAVGTATIGGQSAGAAVNGESLNKVGRTTGWTQGDVTNSCANVAVAGAPLLYICQDIVGAGVGGGDSGSPVFKIKTGNDVTLHGILWGGYSDGSAFVYSPIANVQRSGELGALSTCAAGC